MLKKVFIFSLLAVSYLSADFIRFDDLEVVFDSDKGLMWQDEKDLPNYFKNHELKGELEGFLEIHLSGDLLLVYCISNEKLQLLRIGTHSQIFKKF